MLCTADLAPVCGRCLAYANHVDSRSSRSNRNSFSHTRYALRLATLVIAVPAHTTPIYRNVAELSLALLVHIRLSTPNVYNNPRYKYTI